MRQTWRWFGPADDIALSEICQTGAEGIVSALHHIPTGEVWSKDEIQTRKTIIEAAAPLTWDVVESLPVSEAIKTQSEDFGAHCDAYRQSLRNLAACGISTICYNFMPILDWTRTELAAVQRNGATAMRFDLVDFAVFDLHLLRRTGATDDYSPALMDRASDRFARLNDTARAALSSNIVAGLPGANERWTLEDVRTQLRNYDGITTDQLRSNMVDFLSEIVPTAEEVGVRLCCHPDDPPFSLLGLPRIMSSEDDYRRLIDAIDSPANGITLCTGSLGVAEDFDPVSFIEALGHRIHFVHLRNTRRDGPTDAGRSSFFESEHLDGDTNLVATIGAVLSEEERRLQDGRADWEIPFRPDHGQSMLSDLNRPGMPGYPLIGRMRGLAEIRGVIAAKTSSSQG